MKIVDGDTVHVLSNSIVHKVRLAKVDAPERGQAFGKKAKAYLGSLVRELVTVSIETTDRYGRPVGIITYEGVDVNLLLVKAGLAWVYRKYTEDRVYIQAENRAKQEKLGLWIDPQPTPQWEWRRQKRSRIKR